MINITDITDILSRLRVKSGLTGSDRVFTRRNRPQDLPALAEATRICNRVLNSVRNQDENFYVDQHSRTVWFKEGGKDFVVTFVLDGTRTYAVPSEMGVSITIGLLGRFSGEFLRAVEWKRTALIHEITHALDYKRFGTTRWKAAVKSYPKEPRTARPAYYNHPVELNAYFQQALAYATHKLTIALDEIGGQYENDRQAGVWKLYDYLQANDTFDKFWAVMARQLQVVDSIAFMENVNAPNLRKFKRRAYGVWAEAMGNAQEAFDRLLAQGDEMALFMVRE